MVYLHTKLPVNSALKDFLRLKKIETKLKRKPSHRMRTQERQFTYDVTIRCVRETIVAVARQQVLFISVCACAHVAACVCVGRCQGACACARTRARVYPYLSSMQHACAMFYCHLWPLPPSYFRYLLINGTIFEKKKKVTEHIVLCMVVPLPSGTYPLAVNNNNNNNNINNNNNNMCVLIFSTDFT